MKRDVVINSMLGGNGKSATIIINKDGLQVANKSDNAGYENDKYFISSFLRQCIDMDEWIHSRYVSIDNAMRQGTDDRKKCRKILEDKIAFREVDIAALKDALQVLSKCK